MSRMTERDQKAYQFLVETRLPVRSSTMAKLFYPAGNFRSSLTICQRRMRVLKELQYVEISPKKFGSEIFYYVGKLNPTSLRHRLTMSDVIATVATSGIELIRIEIEKKMPDKYGIVSDLCLTCRYNKEIFILIVEVDITKTFNENYEQLIKDLKAKTLRFNYPVYILSVCDSKISNEFIKAHVTQLKTDLSDFNKFLFNFYEK